MRVNARRVNPSSCRDGIKLTRRGERARQGNALKEAHLDLLLRGVMSPHATAAAPHASPLPFPQGCLPPQPARAPLFACCRCHDLR